MNPTASISSVVVKMWLFTLLWCWFASEIIAQDTKSQSKTYFFNLNKTTNEFKVYNRINMSRDSKNIPQIYPGELRNNVSQISNTTKNHPLLDNDWNYNWTNTTRTKLPQYIYKLYESENGLTHILFNSLPQNSTLLQFNLSGLTPREKNSETELHFYQIVDKQLFQKPLIVRLYQVEHNYSSSPDTHKLLNIIYISQAQSGWQVFKLTNTIQNWRNDSLMLMITVSKPNEDQFVLLNDSNRDVFRTFLVLKNAERFETIPKSEKALEDNFCHVQDMYIDFDRMKWMQFIILPTGYNAFSCSGRCYKTERTSNHMKITSFFPEVRRKSLCCVPTNYNPLRIMFYDKHGNIIIKLYKEMIISACGCR